MYTSHSLSVTHYSNLLVFLSRRIVNEHFGIVALGIVTKSLRRKKTFLSYICDSGKGIG